jgi:hypothetical protein
MFGSTSVSIQDKPPGPTRPESVRKNATTPKANMAVGKRFNALRGMVSSRMNCIQWTQKIDEEVARKKTM